MEGLDYQKLEGWRSPTVDEVSKITRYIQKKYKYWNTVGILAEIFLLVLIISFTSGYISLVIEKSVSDKEVVFTLILDMFCMTLIFYNLKRGFGRKKFFKDIELGKYSVLDCYSYRYENCQEAVGEEGVYIETVDGVKCKTLFLVDYGTVKSANYADRVHFLLVWHRGFNYSVLMSERRMLGQAKN